MRRGSKKLNKPLLIWVYGEADTGKTGIIKSLASRLRPLCLKFVEHKQRVSDVSDESVLCQFQNYRVAMSSAGDFIKDVADNINKFSRLHADVIVVAARKRFIRWNPRMQSHLKQNAKNWLMNCDVIEIPRLIQGWKNENCVKNTVIIGCSSEDLFLFLIRTLKHGILYNSKNKAGQPCNFSLYELIV